MDILFMIVIQHEGTFLEGSMKNYVSSAVKTSFCCKKQI